MSIFYLFGYMLFTILLPIGLFVGFIMLGMGLF